MEGVEVELLPGPSPWSPVPEPTQEQEPDEGGHRWRLAGTKRDEPVATTYFLWGCASCGGRTVTETPSLEGECFADQCLPDASSMRRGRTDPDCLLNQVRLVHER